MVLKLCTIDAFFQPVRSSGPFQVMVKKLHHPHTVIFSVFHLCQSVILALVLHQHDRLFQPAQGIVELDPLREIDRTVFVVVQHQQRCRHLFDMIHR